MKELSLHILDISQNSVKAGAGRIGVTVDEQPRRNTLTITITDNGCGMTPEFVEKVIDPFTTTRTTRKVGLGVPFFRQAALQTGGHFEINSTVNVGTEVVAVFVYDSIDRMPLGDMPATFVTLLGSAPEVDWVFTHRYCDQEYRFSSAEIEQELGKIDYTAPEIIAWLKEYFDEQKENLYGGNYS